MSLAKKVLNGISAGIVSLPIFVGEPSYGSNLKEYDCSLAKPGLPTEICKSLNDAIRNPLPKLENHGEKRNDETRRTDASPKYKIIEIQEKGTKLLNSLNSEERKKLNIYAVPYNPDETIRGGIPYALLEPQVTYSKKLPGNHVAVMTCERTRIGDNVADTPRRPKIAFVPKNVLEDKKMEIEFFDPINPEDNLVIREKIAKCLVRSDPEKTNADSEPAYRIGRYPVKRNHADMAINPYEITGKNPEILKNVKR